MPIKKYLADIKKIALGTTEYTKVYLGTTQLWAASTDIVCTPYSISGIESMPYTTVNVDCDRAGTIYFEISGAGPYDYFEIEWYKNNTYQDYLLVWNGSSYDLGPTSITVAAGDDIKFLVGASGSAAWRGRMTNSSGNIIFTGYIEAA
jgi:hypothetical protein